MSDPSLLSDKDPLPSPVSSRFVCRRSLLLPSLCLAVVLGAILLFVLLYLFVWRTDSRFFTNVICRPDSCPASSIPLVDKQRAIGNKVDLSFVGYVDVWASDGADVFTTDMHVEAGQAWPRMYQGATAPLLGEHRTPRFPLPLTTLVVGGNATGSANDDSRSVITQRYVSYNASWRARVNGPEADSATAVTGNLYNGCYIWLSDRDNATHWDSYPTPRWPYDVEINVWHRYAGVGYRSGAVRFKDYYDNMGRYQVFGHETEHDGDRFYAYYVLLQRDRETSDFEINLNTLVDHLVRYTGSGNTSAGAAIGMTHEIVEIAVAAEGRETADGQFKAYVYTMGRTEEERKEDNDGTA